MTAIVALTAQDTTGVHGTLEVPPEFVELQLQTVFGDPGVDAAKTGMLFSRRIIETVADFLDAHPVPLVVDPVMVASSGARLLREDAVDVLVDRLFPLAAVGTPNLAEAQGLAGGGGRPRGGRQLGGAPARGGCRRRAGRRPLPARGGGDPHPGRGGGAGRRRGQPGGARGGDPRWWRARRDRHRRPRRRAPRSPLRWRRPRRDPGAAPRRRGDPRRRLHAFRCAGRPPRTRVAASGRGARGRRARRARGGARPSGARSRRRPRGRARSVIGDALARLRERRPLVHQITNYVVMNETANAT